MGKNNKRVPASQVAETETSAPESSVEAKPSARELFQACDAADLEVKASELELDGKKQLRSDAIKRLAEAHGNGPFDYDGRKVSITTRTETKTDEAGESFEVPRYFFKSHRQTVQVV